MLKRVKSKYKEEVNMDYEYICYGFLLIFFCHFSGCFVVFVLVLFSSGVVYRRAGSVF